MPKHAVDESSIDRPVKGRRFPWRLWLWALIMTAAAGAGGYFTWYYRNEVATASNASSECEGSLKTLKEEARSCKAELETHRTESAATGQKLAELNTEHTKIKNERDQLSKSLTVSKDELVALREAKDKAEA